MAWVRIDDQIGRHEKLFDAGPAACWLWVLGLAHCQSQLTDGFISDKFIPMLGITRGFRPLVNRLVATGLWHAADGGFQVHDYLDFNDSRAIVLERRATDAARKRGGVRSESKQTPDGLPVDSKATPTVPSHPIPSHPEKRESVRENPETLSPQSRLDFDKVYGVYPNKDRKEQANRAWVELWPSNELASTIYADIVRRTAAGWVKLERRFIPHLATYLHDRMWEDDVGVEPIDADEAERMKTLYAWTCQTCGEIHELLGGGLIRERTKKPLPCQKQLSPVTP